MIASNTHITPDTGLAIAWNILVLSHWRCRPIALALTTLSISQRLFMIAPPPWALSVRRCGGPCWAVRRWTMVS